MRSVEAYSYRRDTSVPAFADDKPVIVFDGMCVMCSRFAQIVMRRDVGKRFRLLAAQSALGAALYRHYGLDTRDYETNVLIAEGQAYFKSEASIRILEQLGLPWSFARFGRALPLGVRDWIYGIVARNRLAWFGVRDRCFIPAPEERDRFL